VLSLPPTVRVFVAVEPIDMRGSFDALAGAVRRLGLDPVDGHLYLFLNKRRRIAKALWFDGSGWCVLAKRLEAGSFQLPPLETVGGRVQIDGAAFASLLAGIDFTAARGAGIDGSRAIGIDIDSRTRDLVAVPSTSSRCNERTPRCALKSAMLSSRRAREAQRSASPSCWRSRSASSARAASRDGEEAHEPPPRRRPMQQKAFDARPKPP
jgi:transposase